MRLTLPCSLRSARDVFLRAVSDGNHADLIYQGKPVRLEITCSRQGHEPWVIQRAAKVTYAIFVSGK